MIGAMLASLNDPRPAIPMAPAKRMTATVGCDFIKGSLSFMYAHVYFSAPTNKAAMQYRSSSFQKYL
jgi:hypothetical protein